VRKLTDRLENGKGGDVDLDVARSDGDLHRPRDAIRTRRPGRLGSVRDRIDRRAMAALSSGHAAVDFAGGALFVLIPYLHDKFALSYTLTATLVLCAAISGSVVQPLFGLWSDRHGAIWLIPAGVLVGGVGVALAAEAPAYVLAVVFVIISGLGTAAFHPEGSKFAAYVSGRRRASGMSLFSVGGNIGFGLGALAAALLVDALGLRGGVLLALPCLVVAAVLLGLRGYLLGFVPEHETRTLRRGADDRRALGLLLAVITFRSLAWYGLLTFVPLWEESIGRSRQYGTGLLWGMLLVGGIGTLAAGPTADRIGTRAVLLAANVAICPLMLVFVLVGGAPGAVALGFVGVAIIGTFGVTMVMAQEYLPSRIGMASGLSIGFSIGLGGVAAVFLGAIADSVDLRTALYVSCAAPVVAVLLTLLLPKPELRRRLEPAEVAVP
jgi:FSR family fosmidomycin resistance protein-like MFS transporter